MPADIDQNDDDVEDVDPETELPAEEENEDNMPFPEEEPVNKLDVESDDSEDNEVLIRTGNIPDNWYDEYDHVGYDIKGSKVQRVQKDELEEFLRRQKDPEWWREIEDKLNNKSIRLSKADLELIAKVRKGQYADGLVDPFDEEFGQVTFDYPDKIHPMNDKMPKRRFIRSLNERNKINKYAYAIKKGWLKVRTKEEIEAERESRKEKIWDIWQDETITSWRPSRMPPAITAPKKDFPTNAESYNPSKEFLLDEEEKEEQEKLDPEDQMYNFEPTAHQCLRKVPVYKNLINEHFERCLDLYLAPRMIKQRVNIDAKSLIPEIPAPQELRPFPTKVSVTYTQPGNARVRSISVSPCGEFLATGNEDGDLIVYQVRTGRIKQQYKLDGVIDCVQWNPNRDMPCLAVVQEMELRIILPKDLFQPALYRDMNQLFNSLQRQYIAPTA